MHTRLPCLSLSPRVCSNSCPLSQWCHPTISSSVTPFSFCPQSFPVPGSFPLSQLFTSGGQSIGASVHPMNIQGWFPLGLTSLILQSKGLSESSPASQFESIHSPVLSLLYGPTHICTWPLENDTICKWYYSLNFVIFIVGLYKYNWLVYWLHIEKLHLLILFFYLYSILDF